MSGDGFGREGREDVPGGPPMKDGNAGAPAEGGRSVPPDMDDAAPMPMPDPEAPDPETSGR